MANYSTYSNSHRAIYSTPDLDHRIPSQHFTYLFHSTDDVNANATSLFYSSSVGSKSSNDDVTSIDDYMWIYFSPVILILGLCGNILILAVMRRKRLGGTTTSVYLPVMAVFDTIALCYGVVPEWFKSCGIIIFREVHPFLCKMEKFVFYTTSDTAIWVLVLFTIDRLVAVCFPLKKNVVCVPRRSKIVCAIACACAVAKNLHVFWTRGAEFNNGVLTTNCGKPDAYREFETKHRPLMALTLISILPFCILLVCNCLIIWTLTKSRYVQMRRMEASTERTKTFKQTTMMCLSASFVFLICVIPSIVLLIGKPYWTQEPNFAYEVSKAVTNQLAYFNHSINFFLYCMTGQKFRTELVSMFYQVRHSILSDSGLRSSHTAAARSTIPLALLHVNRNAVDPMRANVRGHACAV